MAELLVARGIRTDYVTRELEESGTGLSDSFTTVGVWRGEIYDANGVRRTRGALGFAGGVFRHFMRRRRSYDVVIASALPVLTVLAVRGALIGSGTRVIADWLEVWPARKWREYAGTIPGTAAAVLQWLAAHLVTEHSVNSRFTSDRLSRVSPKSRPVVLGLVDLTESGRPTPIVRPPYALFVGRLIPDKAPAEIPEALARAREHIPDLRAVIVGVGPEDRRVVEAAEHAGVRSDVDIVGRVDDDVLDTLRAGASVFVAPSIREGFGLAVAEALAWGVPAVVVAHADNAAVDLVDEGINGFIVEPGSAAALAAGIVEAVRGGPALRRSTAEWFARARVERGLASSLDQILNRSGR
jgi:glycosyltransferase involved in cell wall biosynthesis